MCPTDFDNEDIIQMVLWLYVDTIQTNIVDSYKFDDFKKSYYHSIGA